MACPQCLEIVKNNSIHCVVSDLPITLNTLYSTQNLMEGWNLYLYLAYSILTQRLPVADCLPVVSENSVTSEQGIYAPLPPSLPPSNLIRRLILNVHEVAIGRYVFIVKSDSDVHHQLQVNLPLLRK